ncbi:MAG TPA: Uma2 family endonuclease [Candidatus Polarisedimenticolaceae bacterium]|nr:Uma2 family endonuclease [Candidatus Polarisedimenticolaceae bacterium]
MRAPDRQERLTVDALYAMPDHGYRYELQAGLLLSEPLPGFRHGRLVANLAAIIHEHVKAHRLGVVVTGDPGFILARNPDTLRGPDIAFVSQRRADEQRDNLRAFEGPPDLAVEVLSPSDVPAEVRTKVAEYLAAGTQLVWIVDPESRTVTTYPSIFAPNVLDERDLLEGADVVPGFRVRVVEIFEP